MINITLLGTSALLPLPERAETSAFLSCGGHSILFDCGEGTQTAARKAGVSLIKTDIIALTHYHGDHIFGIPGLLQTMSVMGRKEPLYIIGPENIDTELAPILQLIGWVGFEVRTFALPTEGLMLNKLNPAWPDGAKLTAFPTAHRVASQGYIFTLDRAGRFSPENAKKLGVPVNRWSMLQKGEAVSVGDKTVLPEMVMGKKRSGLKVVFTGDTSPCESLEHAAEGADLLICEATYGEDSQADFAAEYGHMTFAQAGQTAAKAKVRRLWLMHFSQMIKKPEDYLPNAQKFFPTAECGYDGKTIQLDFDNGE